MPLAVLLIHRRLDSAQCRLISELLHLAKWQLKLTSAPVGQGQLALGKGTPPPFTRQYLWEGIQDY